MTDQSTRWESSPYMLIRHELVIEGSMPQSTKERAALPGPSQFFIASVY